MRRISGSGMVFSMVVFSIASVYVRGWLRFYYLAVAVAAAYGFGLSGTRSAVIVPFVGYALYILTTKNKRILLAGVVTLAILFGFFKFTHIGDGNVMIYRIRSAFQSDRRRFFPGAARKSGKAEEGGWPISLSGSGSGWAEARRAVSTTRPLRRGLRPTRGM